MKVCFSVSMVTMEPVNTPRKRRRGRRKNGERPPTDPLMDPPSGAPQLDGRQVVSALHSACLSGHLPAIRLLLESCSDININSRDVEGLRPVHMVLTPHSSPSTSSSTSSCLLLLLEHGANVNVATDSGVTPLHMAASEGLLTCTEILVQAGADVSAKDANGHTPLDLARVWCRRDVARFLKSCTWWSEKRKETHERKLVQELYRDLVERVKLNEINKKALIDEKMAEWASKKGLPVLKPPSPRVLAVSQRHTECLPSLQISPPNPTKSPRDPRDPDLRDQVRVGRGVGGAGGVGGRPHYTTLWDPTPCPAPALPLDVLERALFPRAFPSRIQTPGHFGPRDIGGVQHRGQPQGHSSSPWTDVAMHLAEELQPGHY